MKFSMFKKGTPKEKNKQAGAGDDSSVQVTDLEEELNKSTNNLMEKEKQLKTLSGNGTEEIKAVPHGPIGELKVEPGDKGQAVKPLVAADAAPADAADEIKVVEVKVDAVINKKETKPEAAATPPAPPKAEKKDENQSLNSLFQSEEEDENPLANLIKGLPDVSADELMKDLNEIRDIIKEWQKKS